MQEKKLSHSPTRQFYCATPIIAHSPAFRKRGSYIFGFRVFAVYGGAGDIQTLRRLYSPLTGTPDGEREQSRPGGLNRREDISDSGKGVGYEKNLVFAFVAVFVCGDGSPRAGGGNGCKRNLRRQSDMDA